MTRLLRKLRDESGMSYVFVGLSFMAFISASILAIDVGMLMTARNQAQNSADAGALAGAVALAFDDYDDRSATGPAVTSAIAGAKANQVMAGDVSVKPTDVEFLNNEDGLNNRVKVTVYRTSEPGRDNPLPLLMARYLRLRETADIGATATAEASPANAQDCVLPFTIPDRWNEMHTPAFDPNDDFEAFKFPQGTPLANPDEYIGPEDKDNYTGYNPHRDRGMQIALKADQGSKLAPSMYQVWDVEGANRGSDDVRDAVCGCKQQVLGYGQTFVHKPGFQAGPVEQGIECLINKDPGAYWDDVNKRVVTTMAKSPRIRAIPLFDPWYYDQGNPHGRVARLKFVNYLGFFIEGMKGNEVVGRIVPIGGLTMGSLPDGPPAAFPYSILLVK